MYVASPEHCFHRLFSCLSPILSPFFIISPKIFRISRVFRISLNKMDGRGGRKWREVVDNDMLIAPYISFSCLKTL